MPLMQNKQILALLQCTVCPVCTGPTVCQFNNRALFSIILAPKITAENFGRFSSLLICAEKTPFCFCLHEFVNIGTRVSQNVGYARSSRCFSRIYRQVEKYGLVLQQIVFISPLKFFILNNHKKTCKNHKRKLFLMIFSYSFTRFNTLYFK